MKIILQAEVRNLSNREIAENYHNLIDLLSKIGSFKNRFANTKTKPANN